jgi:hypothetical protein
MSTVRYPASRSWQRTPAQKKELPHVRQRALSIFWEQLFIFWDDFVVNL